MPTVMVPSKLWKRFGLPGSPLAVGDDEHGRLGNWSLGSVGAEVGELALFVNQRTCLTVLVPMEPLPVLMESFGVELADELRRHDVGPALIRDELIALAGAKLGKNTDRSLLGTVNDLIWHAEGHAEQAKAIREACRKGQAGLRRAKEVFYGTVAQAVVPALEQHAVGHLELTRGRRARDGGPRLGRPTIARVANSYVEC